MDRSSLCTQVIHQVNHSLIKSSSVCTIIIFTVRNEVAKVMFLHVCVCPQRGSTWASTPRDQVHPPGPGTSHRTRYTTYPPGTRCTHPGTRYTPPWPGTPRDQVHPPGPGTPPPWTRYTPRRRLLLRTVRILLECILVWKLTITLAESKDFGWSCTGLKTSHTFLSIVDFMKLRECQFPVQTHHWKSGHLLSVLNKIGVTALGFTTASHGQKLSSLGAIFKISILGYFCLIFTISKAQMIYSMHLLRSQKSAAAAAWFTTRQTRRHHVCQWVHLKVGVWSVTSNGIFWRRTCSHEKKTLLESQGYLVCESQKQFKHEICK